MIIALNFFRAGSTGHDKSTLAKRRAEMTAVVEFAMSSLIEHSPVGGDRDRHAGLYRDSHTLFLNGNDVADISAWMPGDEIEISNPVPYARILEVGDHRARAPHHTYELAEQALQDKYGDIARIELNYMPVKFGGVQTWAQSASGRALAGRVRRGNPSLKADWLVRQPVLKIKGLD